MAGLEEIKDEVHSLGKEIAGLRPLVHEMHNNMPRIVEALETLARVTEKLENNADDHKRLHYRITDVEVSVKALKVEHNGLDERFVKLKEEHIVCTTTQKVTSKVEKSGVWAKIKAKFTDKALELMIIATLGFVAWMVMTNFALYLKSLKLAVIIIYTGGVA